MNLEKAIRERIIELAKARNVTINKVSTLAGLTHTTLLSFMKFPYSSISVILIYVVMNYHILQQGHSFHILVVLIGILAILLLASLRGVGVSLLGLLLYYYCSSFGSFIPIKELGFGTSVCFAAKPRKTIILKKV